MTSPRVIGLYSPAPQQGKSTVAKYLARRHGFHILSFATPLKRMATQFLHGMGYSPGEIEHFLTEGKSMRIPEMGVNTRHILQTLGYEWGRQCIHPDVWVRMWERQAKHYLSMGVPVVSDDVRFQNEYRALFNLQSASPVRADFWRITRSSIYDRVDHPSEGFAENGEVEISAEVHNYGSERDLEQRVEELLLLPSKPERT